jgi:hypothetical protein
METTQNKTERLRRADLRAGLLALAGAALLVAGVACIDWRAGLILAGVLALLASFAVARNVALERGKP